MCSSSVYSLKTLQMLVLFPNKSKPRATVSQQSHLVLSLTCRLIRSRHLVQRGLITSWGSVAFLYFLDFGGGGVEEGKLSLAGVLLFLEFGTLSAGHSESQITLSFSLPSFGLHCHNGFAEKQQLRPRMCWLLARALCFNSREETR